MSLPNPLRFLALWLLPAVLLVATFPGILAGNGSVTARARVEVVGGRPQATVAAPAPVAEGIAVAPPRFTATRWGYSVTPAVALLRGDGVIVATAGEVKARGGALTADGRYAFPLPVEVVTLSMIRGNHHTYPASDLLVPEGTPVFAVHGGVVTRVSLPCEDPDQCRCGLGVSVTGEDGHTYTYCHGSQLAGHIHQGAAVSAGELIMMSGNTGRSSAPHLHLQIRSPAGQLVCPQDLLESWWQRISLSPVGTPSSGCTYPTDG